MEQYDLILKRLEESKKKAETVRARLDSTVSEVGDGFMSGADNRFFSDLSDRIDQNEESNSTEAGCAYQDIKRGSAGGSNIADFTLTDRDEKILSKIVAHSKRYQETGEVAYLFNEDFISPQEIAERLGYVIRHKPRTAFNRVESNFKLKKLLGSFERQISRNQPLSAKQVVIIEDTFNKASYSVNALDELVDQGAVFFEPPLNEKGKLADMQYASLLIWDGLKGKTVRETEYNPDEEVNHALGRLIGSRIKSIGQNEILAFRELYTGENSQELSSLLDRENKKIKGKDFERKSTNYSRMAESLDSYVSGINPDEHFVYGIQCYFPRDARITHKEQK